MTDTEIKLISYISDGTTDDYAQPIRTRHETLVLATEVPVSRSEFSTAGQAGILPSFEFLINPAEYHGEEEVEIERFGETVCLRVYRVYEAEADILELYCQRAAGLNGRATS